MTEADSSGGKLRRRRWWPWLRNAVLLVIVIAVVRAYTQSGVVRGAAPEFQGRLLDGSSIALQDFRGRPVMLHFWASWCPVCKLEHDSIQQLSRDHAVITVAMNSGDAHTLNTFMKGEALSFPVLPDPEGQLARRYGVRGVPASFFIDEQGNIRFTEVGYTTETGMRLRMWWLQ